MFATRNLIRSGIGSVFAALLVFPAAAQLATLGATVELPRTSPAAEVTQRVGLTDITVSYHRPGVKGRDVWKAPIVPYNGDPVPWRAGANENTTFTFSTDVTIDGNALAAGTYGFHIIPRDGAWTLIFSNDSTAWGSYFYNPENDALRIEVTPVETPHREWLMYGFSELGEDSCVAFMEWGNKRIEFNVDVDLEETVLTSLRSELIGFAGLTWNGNYQAAKWCLENETNYEEALKWAEASINRNRNDFNLRVKGELLLKLGRPDEARAALEEALQLAPEDRKEAIQEELQQVPEAVL